jgi:hypothetical protein
LRIYGVVPLYLGSAPVSDGSLAWTIDSSISSGSDYTISIESQDTCGYSVYAGSWPFTITRSTPTDFDRDSDVDIADFQHFAACFNGPNRPPAGDICADADVDGDGDIDLADYLAFQACFNGPNRPPACP